MLQSLIFALLVANVLTNQRFVSTHRRDDISPRPKVLPDKIAFSLTVDAGEVDSTCALEVPHYLRYRLLRRNRDQHVHMIRPQMSLFDTALLLLSQLMEHFSQMAPHLLVERSAPALWDKHYVIFALPLGVA